MSKFITFNGYLKMLTSVVKEDGLQFKALDTFLQGKRKSLYRLAMVRNQTI